MISNAQSLLSSPQIRKKAESALAAGQEIFIKSPTGATVDPDFAQKYLDKLSRRIEVGRSAVTAVQVPQTISLPKSKTPAMAGAAAAGAAVGVSVSVIIQQLKIAHPASALTLDAAFAVIGGVFGGALAGGVTIEIFAEPDGKVGARIAPPMQR